MLNRVSQILAGCRKDSRLYRFAERFLNDLKRNGEFCRHQKIA